MEFNRDEVRRELRAADRAHREAMKPWREALLRIFADGEHAPEAARAQLAGAPDRRSFLRIGGISVAGATVLAACGKKKAANKPGQSGTTQPTTTAAADAPSTTAVVPTTQPNPDDAKLDLSLLRTATSIELLAVAVYAKAAPLVKDPTVLAAAKLFSDQHSEHARLLQATTRQSFGADKVYDKPNEYLMTNLVTPTLPNLKSDLDIAQFALSLENTAASTYVFAASQLSVAKLRQAIMAIGGVEARHAAVLGGVLKTVVPTESFFTIRDAAPKDSLV